MQSVQWFVRNWRPSSCCVPAQMPRKYDTTIIPSVFRRSVLHSRFCVVALQGVFMRNNPFLTLPLSPHTHTLFVQLVWLCLSAIHDNLLSANRQLIRLVVIWKRAIKLGWMKYDPTIWFIGVSKFHVHSVNCFLVRCSHVAKLNKMLFWFAAICLMQSKVEIWVNALCNCE